jgi:hypothetical protein
MIALVREEILCRIEFVLETQLMDFRMTTNPNTNFQEPIGAVSLVEIVILRV